MSQIMADTISKTQPYRVSTDEVQKSLEWLEEEYKTANMFVGSQRSEVKEIRFKAQDASSIKDEDILRKFREAQALDIQMPACKKSNTSH